ncbi:MAG: outer membrane beta-barrel protein [Tateyamaria sp.]|uniref:outer membrane protein n=1 Tax=Tateyamaria sp. TaxID=1929288 RepID=UPI00326CC914
MAQTTDHKISSTTIARAATIALSVTLGVFAAPDAQAQDTGLYGFGFGGFTFNGQQDGDGNLAGASNSVDTDYDDDFQLGFGVGRKFSKLSSDKIGVRGEIELSYGESDADEIRFSGNNTPTEINVGGGIEATTLFANIYADFETGGALTPFVGAGVGVGRFSQDLIYGPGVQVSESDTAFGLQLIAGAAYEVSDKLTLTADARYREFYDIESNRFDPTGASTGVVSGDFSAVSINFGARIAF